MAKKHYHSRIGRKELGTVRGETLGLIPPRVRDDGGYRPLRGEDPPGTFVLLTKRPVGPLGGVDQCHTCIDRYTIGTLETFVLEITKAGFWWLT